MFRTQTYHTRRVFCVRQGIEQTEEIWNIQLRDHQSWVTYRHKVLSTQATGTFPSLPIRETLISPVTPLLDQAEFNINNHQRWVHRSQIPRWSKALIVSSLFQRLKILHYKGWTTFHFHQFTECLRLTPLGPHTSLPFGSSRIRKSSI